MKAREKHPVGATWEYRSPKTGSVGRVWLRERAPTGHEFWQYQFWYRDGSGREEDWAQSRRKAVEFCAVFFGEERLPVRFARVPDQEERETVKDPSDHAG